MHASIWKKAELLPQSNLPDKCNLNLPNNKPAQDRHETRTSMLPPPTSRQLEQLKVFIETVAWVSGLRVATKRLEIKNANLSMEKDLDRVAPQNFQRSLRDVPEVS